MKWPPHEQKCRLCGSERELTRHHLVPRQWFRLRPPRSKVTHDRFNIVVLCLPCHNDIEGSLSPLALAREMIAQRKHEARQALRRKLTADESAFVVNTAGEKWFDKEYPAASSHDLSR